MSKLITVSPSPHLSGEFSVQKIMLGVIVAMLPALAISVYYFGIQALIVTLVAVISALACEFLIQKYLLKGATSVTDLSAIVTGMLLAFNVPTGLPIWIVVLGSVVSIGVGKMSFGGLGANPFNPALVGRVFLLISFPVQMTTWPTNRFAQVANPDAITGATPLGVLKEAIKNGESMSSILQKLPDTMDLFLGNMGGSLGEISAFAILIGGVYMIMKKIITWHIPVITLATVFIFAWVLNMVNPELYVTPMFHLLSGGIILGAVFMATDMVTSPMTPLGMAIFAVGIGALTIIIRVWGAYPEGVSFAILIMNAFTPIINRYCKPKRFGEEVKHG